MPPAARQQQAPTPSATRPYDASLRGQRASPKSNHRELGRTFLRMVVSSYIFAKFPTYNARQLVQFRESILAPTETASQEAIGQAYSLSGVEDALKETLCVHSLYGIQRWLDLVELFWEEPFTDLEDIKGMPHIPKVEQLVGYIFVDRYLLVQALCQTWNPKDRTPTCGRLGFLGDSVLDFIASEWWADRFPEYDSGSISRLRVASTRNTTLGTICLKSGLHTHIWNRNIELDTNISRAQEALVKVKKSGNRLYWNKAQICKSLAEVVASVIGAVYVDSGLDLARVKSVFERLYWPVIGVRMMEMETNEKRMA